MNKLSKDEFEILDRINHIEADGLLPAQLNSTRLSVLEAAGYIAPMTKTLEGRFPVTVRGWQLTDLGRNAVKARMRNHPWKKQN